jgi:hypothetical protein
LIAKSPAIASTRNARSFVDDERDHALGFPRRKLVVELAAGGHAPQKQRRGGNFGMIRCCRERRERVEERLAAALGDVDVMLDEHLVVRLVGQPHADETEPMLRRECLPHHLVYLPASVAVGSRHEDDERAHGRGAVRQPQTEFRFVVVCAGRHHMIERQSGDKRERQQHARIVAQRL